MLLTRTTTTLLLALSLALPMTLPAADSAELGKLQGIWNAKTTGSGGEEVSHILGIKNDKLTFKMLNKAGDLRLFAKGMVKTEKLGPFHVLQISSLEAGQSEDNTSSVDDELSTIYSLDEDTLILASNFDRQREDRKPTLTIYTRTFTPKDTAPTAEKLVGKWKMSVKLNETEREYDLALALADGKLSGTITSPRSGEYKLKSAGFADGKLSMELVREIQGVEANIQYSGELKADQLTGTFAVKGAEDQYKGTWAAKR